MKWMQKTMKSGNAFLADTYALIKLFEKDDAYLEYRKKHFYITEHILVEFAYYLIRIGEIPDKYINSIASRALDLNISTIIESMKFRFAFKEKKFSYVDCVSYTRALELGIKFLTGDKQFKGMPNVEFVR